MPTDGEIRELNAKMAGDYAKADADFLRAENARLQTRVEEAEHNLETHLLGYSPYRAELDRYKALAERRGEALVTAIYWRDKLAAKPESQEAWEALVEEGGCLNNEARATINMKPEEAKEKAVLLAALEDARMLCMNDHAYDNETSQVFEAVQVINHALEQGREKKE